MTKFQRRFRSDFWSKLRSRFRSKFPSKLGSRCRRFQRRLQGKFWSFRSRFWWKVPEQLLEHFADTLCLSDALDVVIPGR